ncbi:adenosylcobinamide-GDP ribazoletransferase [Dyella sp. C11]|uniref:adenosylcobinamide-GDP ribazoletransferase n=1 Tax=Dyella sp. C11 TaxID=2126991 RepID=UPI000D65BC01|nr:adenosylcobinamide-GDP ribazoletransferase [Dyella sp. C11]
MMRGFFAAIGFLTRIPLPARAFDEATPPSAPLPWYPMVGLVIGACLWVLGWLLSGAPPLLAGALLLAAWVALTGALHLDGLADSADAWVGGLGDRERTLVIMKDPRSGPMGVAAVVLVLLVKFAALASLAQPSVVLLVAPMLGRAALTVAFMTTPYVRSGGLGSGLAEASRAACLVAAIATAVLVLCTGWHGIRALLVSVAVFAWWRWVCVRRLGGMTGDTCGALTELTELAVLVAWAL